MYRPKVRMPVVRPKAKAAHAAALSVNEQAAAVVAAMAQAEKIETAHECWRVARVARLLDVSKKRVYQLVRARRLEAIRLGPRQMRILKRSIDAYVVGLLEKEKERIYY